MHKAAQFLDIFFNFSEYFKVVNSIYIKEVRLALLGGGDSFLVWFTFGVFEQFLDFKLYKIFIM